MGIFSQIRDRRLFQIVASYLAAGWIGLTVVDQFVNRGIVPGLIYEIALIGYLCGIPAAFLVGWHHGEKGEQRAPRSEVAMLTTLALAFLVLSSFSVSDYWTTRRTLEAAQRESETDLSSIGVLYFEDYTGGEHRHIADALTEALIDELTRVPALDVRSRNAAARFRDSELPRDSIAAILGVGTLVGGLIEPRGEGLKVTVRLFEGFNGNELSSTSIDVTSADDILTARDRVVEDVARTLRQLLGDEVRVRAGGQRITNPQAWTLYQRGEKLRKDADARAHDDDLTGAFAAFARADSLLSKASLLAPDWPDPIVLQATTAYRRSRLARERHDILSWVDRAIERAEGAIRISANHARALEARGTAKYWKYLQLHAREPEQAQQLLTDARRDLEEAVRIEPTLASAHSVLSHLLTREDLSSALLAARRAYEADAYLEAAPDILLRLVTGNYDLENFDQMERWCKEGATRFPQSFRFADCQLLLLTTREPEPDIELAWQLQTSLASLSPENRSEYDRVRGLALVGGVIARASQSVSGSTALADSARNVLRRAEAGITHAIDPQQELLALTAYMYTFLGDTRTAIALLRRYAAAYPAASFEHHWRWRELRGLPEFQPLLVEHH